MKKKIIILLILVTTIAISGCINSPVDNINQIMPELNKDIIDGDTSFNEVVGYVNQRDYDQANKRIRSTVNNFNEAQNKMLELKKYYKDVNDSVIVEYIDLLQEEINLKQNATYNLQSAIQLFISGDKESANSYVSVANSLMDEGMSYQEQKAQIVLNYPEKFTI
jgi:hypothetical protein